MTYSPSRAINKNLNIIIFSWSQLSLVFQILGVQVMNTAVGPGVAVLMFIAGGICGEYQLSSCCRNCFIYKSHHVSWPIQGKCPVPSIIGSIKFS